VEGGKRGGQYVACVILLAMEEGKKKTEREGKRGGEGYESGEISRSRSTRALSYRGGKRGRRKAWKREKGKAAERRSTKRCFLKSYIVGGGGGEKKKRRDTRLSRLQRRKKKKIGKGGWGQVGQSS